jgi:FHA domain
MLNSATETYLRILKPEILQNNDLTPPGESVNSSIPPTLTVIILSPVKECTCGRRLCPPIIAGRSPLLHFFVHYSSGLGISKKYYLVNQIYLIGRDRSCHIRVDRFVDTISKKHATINQKAKTEFIITDHSRNGTFINGVRLKSNESRKLRTGDYITLGITEKIFQFINPADPEFVKLSSAETEVLLLVAENPSLTYEELGEKRHRLYKSGSSLNTIRSILANVYAKLEVNSKQEAIERARQLGLLE